jgi:lipopolysaccharide/colanic/teichoic acid biosynthesis glycosyltransferase
VRRSKAEFKTLFVADWKNTARLEENDSATPHMSVCGLTGFLKRFADCIVAAIALILLAPVFAAIALIVRATGGGSVLYRQIRVGFQGRSFIIIKFRTMHDSAERDLGPIWSVPKDPRCTPVGHYLRRLGLDELPQLWNILRGEMSFVGPRPERPQFTREFRKQYHEYDVRQTVKPGLTGYAQIHGWRGYTSLEERLRHDLYYVRNWSLTLDAYIFFMTLLRGWSERTRSGC